MTLARFTAGRVASGAIFALVVASLAMALAPAPETTIFMSSMRLPVILIALMIAAPEIMAVPC